MSAFISAMIVFTFSIWVRFNEEKNLMFQLTMSRNWSVPSKRFGTFPSKLRLMLSFGGGVHRLLRLFFRLRRRRVAIRVSFGEVVPPEAERFTLRVISFGRLAPD
jgi:hypothetical protein